MSAEIARRLINVEEYYKMAEVGILKPTDRVELIRGEIINKMSPISSKHAGVVKNLNQLLNKLLGNEIMIGIQDPVKIDNKNEPEPDISILRQRDDKYTLGHPTPSDVLAIIEVAGSSYAYDTDLKTSLYASASIPVYWVIDIVNNRIELFSVPKEGRYRKMEEFEKADHITLLNHTIPVSDILI